MRSLQIGPFGIGIGLHCIDRKSVRVCVCRKIESEREIFVPDEYKTSFSI